jgi:hypothetical protein
VNTLLECVGVALIVAFAYIVWPPSALLVAGTFLVLTANVLDRRQRKAKS